MIRSGWIKAAAGAAAMGLLLLAPGARAQKELEGVTLNVNGFGGAFDDVLKETVAKPLKEKYGIDVVYTPGTSAAAVAKVIAARDNPPYDLLMVDSPGMPDLIDAGAIEAFTVKDVPAIAGIYPRLREYGDYGVPFIITSMALYYNTEKVKSPPASLADLARPDLKDRVAMFSLENTGGLLNLLAMAESHGGSIADVAPGFAQYKAMKPNLFNTPAGTAGLVQLVEQGEAWAGSLWNGRILYLRDKKVPVEIVIPKEGLYSQVTYINVIKGIPARNRAAAARYVEQALSTEALTGLAKAFYYAPSTAAVKLPPEIAQRTVPYGEAQIAAVKFPDWVAVAKNRPAWTEEWNRMMSQ